MPERNSNLLRENTQYDYHLSNALSQVGVTMVCSAAFKDTYPSQEIPATTIQPVLPLLERTRLQTSYFDGLLKQIHQQQAITNEERYRLLRQLADTNTDITSLEFLNLLGIWATTIRPELTTVQLRKNREGIYEAAPDYGRPLRVDQSKLFVPEAPWTQIQEAYKQITLLQQNDIDRSLARNPLLEVTEEEQFNDDEFLPYALDELTDIIFAEYAGSQSGVIAETFGEIDLVGLRIPTLTPEMIATLRGNHPIKRFKDADTHFTFRYNLSKSVLNLIVESLIPTMQQIESMNRMRRLSTQSGGINWSGLSPNACVNIWTEFRSATRFEKNVFAGYLKGRAQPLPTEGRICLAMAGGRNFKG